MQDDAESRAGLRIGVEQALRANLAYQKAIQSQLQDIGAQVAAARRARNNLRQRRSDLCSFGRPSNLAGGFGGAALPGSAGGLQGGFGQTGGGLMGGGGGGYLV